MEHTKIEWAHDTFNPWRGCEKISAGCKNCYAESLVTRRQGLKVWGANAERRIAAESTWQQPLKWNKQAAAAGERRRVFCASLSDLFEDYHGPSEDQIIKARARLWHLIQNTPALDWLLLTKRPERIAVLLAGWMKDWPRHVWVGCTAENQECAEERIPHLLKIPAMVRFISYEPALGPIDFDRGRCDVHDRRFVVTDKTDGGEYCNECAADGGSGELSYGHWLDNCASPTQHGINWIIVGGESGQGARPFDVRWARRVVVQCRDAQVPVFVKQMGREPFDLEVLGGEPRRVPIRFADRKGGDMEEWPEDLRVRQLPEVAAG